MDRFSRFSRWQVNYICLFVSFFPENRILHFMQMVMLGDNLHGSQIILSEEIEKNISKCRLMTFSNILSQTNNTNNRKNLCILDYPECAKRSFWSDCATWENVPSEICINRRIKSACASAQCDQASLSAWTNFASLAIYPKCPKWRFLTESSLRPVKSLNWIFTGLTYPKIRFLTLRLISCISSRR